MRLGRRAILQAHEGWALLGEPSDGQQAIAGVKLLRLDLVILDVELVNSSGLEAARQIRQHNSLQRMLIFTVCDSDRVIHEAAYTQSIILGRRRSANRGKPGSRRTVPHGSRYEPFCTVLLEQVSEPIGVSRGAVFLPNQTA